MNPRAEPTKSLRDSSDTATALHLIAPWLFVVLWSSGFIGAKYGLPYAEPFTFLLVRMVLACLLLLGVTLAIRAPWPRRPAAALHAAVAGLLLHAVYLGGVFSAIDHGMPAGLSSLIVGLQPVLAATLAQALLRERVTGRQWLGLTLGFGGVALVVGEKASAALSRPIERGAFVAIAAALLATTAGTVYQKRFGASGHLAVTATIQYAAAGVALGVAALAFETMRIEWNPTFVFALAWQVVVLSFGAVLLLLWLIRQTSMARVSSLLYLVPPLTAIEAYVLFDERLGALALAGMAAVVAGVALVVRRPAQG